MNRLELPDRKLKKVWNGIEPILDMQRRGKKDYDQTAELLEKYYRSLDADSRSVFYPVLSTIFHLEPLPPTGAQPTFTIHGAIIKAWARFGPTEKLAPLVFSLMGLESGSRESWASRIYPVFRQALCEYSRRFNEAALDSIAGESILLSAEERLKQLVIDSQSRLSVSPLTCKKWFRASKTRCLKRGWIQGRQFLRNPRSETIMTTK